MSVIMHWSGFLPICDLYTEQKICSRLYAHEWSELGYLGSPGHLRAVRDLALWSDSYLAGGE